MARADRGENGRSDEASESSAEDNEVQAAMSVGDGVVVMVDSSSEDVVAVEPDSTNDVQDPVIAQASDEDESNHDSASLQPSFSHDTTIESTVPLKNGSSKNGRVTPLNLDPGSVVWLKIQKVRWPVFVQDPGNYPEELTDSSRRKPLAVVQFFHEEKYEVIYSEDQLFKYDHPEKINFLRKSLNLLKDENLKKFKSDVQEAEERTGSQEDIWVVLDKLEQESNASKQNLRAAFGLQQQNKVVEKIHYMTMYGAYPTGAEEFDRDKEFKKIRDEVCGEETYHCHWCSFTTTRIDNVVSHFKVHTAGGPRYMPRITSAAWNTMEEQIARQQRKKLKKLAATASGNLVANGNRKRKDVKVNGTPSKKRRKDSGRTQGSLSNAQDLVAEWDEPDEGAEDQNEKGSNRQSNIENDFDALFQETSAPRPSTFNRFSLPSAGDTEDVEDEEVDEDDDSPVPIAGFNPFEFHESDEEVEETVVGEVVEEEESPEAESCSVSESPHVQPVPPSPVSTESSRQPSTTKGSVVMLEGKNGGTGIVTAVVEVPEGSSIPSATGQAVIVEQQDPDTSEAKLLLVTIDEAGKVATILPIAEMSPEQKAALGLDTEVPVVEN